jgi:SAM-dependent methyltransferase
MPGRDEWLTIAASADEADLRERILTGFKGGKPFSPYVPTIAMPRPLDGVLDFGCGVGRNFPYLKSIAARVTGFDLPPMIARCRELSPVPVDELADDWDDLKDRRVSLIFVSLVLQHLETETCRERLADFARMAPVTYLITRREGDFGADMLQLVAESGIFTCGEYVEVDHDPSTHQLRVLGRGPFEDAVSSAQSGHFETLLRSRVFHP